MRSLFFTFGLLLSVNMTYGFVFEAEFTDTGDSPISTASTVKLKVYNPAKDCLLFEEDHIVDLSLTDGKVSVELGSGSQVYLDASYSMPAEILVNYSQIFGQSCTYTTSQIDGRILEVSFDDGTNGLESMGDVNIQPVPQATFASQSGTANNLILANGAFNTSFNTQATASYSLSFPTNAGTNGYVLSTDGAGILNWVDIPSVTICSASEVLLGDGTCAPLPAGGPGSINDVDINGSANIAQSKISNLVADLASKQAVITPGTTNQYLRGDLALADFQNDVQSTLLTGFSSGAGTVAATDTIVEALQKIDGNIAAISTPLDTDGLTEGGVNLYFTDTRAKAATVVNSTAGAETDQAPSVAAMKTYVSASGGTGDILDGGNATAAPITIGTNDANSLKFETNDFTAMTINSVGHVGIGTPNPMSVLNTTGNSEVLFAREDSGGNVRIALNLQSSNNAGPGMNGTGTGINFTAETNVENSMNNIARIEAIMMDATDGSPKGDIVFRNNHLGSMTPKMVIRSSGNVGIGTMIPDAKFHVDGSLKVGDGAEACNTTAHEGLIRFVYPDLQYCDGASWQPLSGGGGILEGGNPTGVDIEIGTTTPQSFILKTDNVPALAINTTQNVGIGTMTPTDRLHVVGNLRIQGTTDCTLGSGSGATNCTSDERLKDEITPIPNALDKIKSVKGVEFVWNDLALSPGRKDIGVIAQDIQKVFPTAVVENNEGYLSVDYAVLVSPLIESVKELDRNQERSLHIQEGSISDNSREIASLKKLNETIMKENREIKQALCALSPELSLCSKK